MNETVKMEPFRPETAKGSSSQNDSKSLKKTVFNAKANSAFEKYTASFDSAYLFDGPPSVFWKEHGHEIEADLYINMT